MGSGNASFNRIEAWRREWFRRERQMILIGVATGAGGIGTGYALFITLHSLRAPTCTQLPEHASGHLGTFWMGVGLAALAALAIEWLRGRARREEGAESFALPQVLSLLVLLGVFELFIMAIHGLLEVPWKPCLSAIFGADSFRARWNLAAFAGLWVLLGAMLAGCLAWSIAQAPPTLGQQLMWSFKIGAISGVVYVPMAVVAYGLLVRLSWGAWTYIASEGWPFPETTFWQHLLLRSGFDLTLWQPILVSLGKTAVLESSVWAVPGLVLGGLAPLLRRPSQLPWIWSPLAFGTAVVCMVLARAPHRFWLLGPALILVVASVWVWFRRRDRLEDLWPLLAMCGALIAFGHTTAVHEVTSLGVYAHLNTVINSPRRPVPGLFGTSVWAIVLGDEDRTLDKELEALEPMPLGEEKIQKLSHLAEQVKTLKDQLAKQPPAWHEFLGMERQDFQQGYLHAIQDYLQERILFEQTLLEWAKNKVPQWFELALIGSLSFWVTFGLLAAWNIAESRPPFPMP